MDSSTYYWLLFGFIPVLSVDSSLTGKSPHLLFSQVLMVNSQLCHHTILYSNNEYIMPETDVGNCAWGLTSEINSFTGSHFTSWFFCSS